MKDSTVVSIYSKQGGAIANNSGKVLEGIVESTLALKGFSPVKYRDWEQAPDLYGEELLLKNAPYTTLYEHAGTTEFLVKSKKHGVETRIECKWQQAQGSVDEKFPYLFLNCTQKMTEPHIIILHDGGGAKKGAVNWLRDACHRFTEGQARTTGRIIELMDIVSFTVWANKVFR